MAVANSKSPAGSERSAGSEPPEHTERSEHAEAAEQTEGLAGPEVPPRSARFKKLPARIRLEDTFTSQDPDAAPDPTMGRDPDRDFMLRNAGLG